MTVTNNAEHTQKIQAGEYPHRPQFFALKYLRLLIRTGIAKEIGQDGICLLTAVVLREDQLHYRPVAFYTAELLASLGFAKWERLDAARTKACKSGWLHYAPPASGSRQAGVYWVLTPDWAIEDREREGPANNPPQTDMHSRALPANGHCAGDRSGDRKGELSIPRPIPRPNESRAHEPGNLSKARVPPFPDFSTLDLTNPIDVANAHEMLAGESQPPLETVALAAAIAVRKGERPPSLFTKLLRDGWGKFPPADQDHEAAKATLRAINELDQ